MSYLKVKELQKRVRNIKVLRKEFDEYCDKYRLMIPLSGGLDSVVIMKSLMNGVIPLSRSGMVFNSVVTIDTVSNQAKSSDHDRVWIDEYLKSDTYKEHMKILKYMYCNPYLGNTGGGEIGYYHAPEGYGGHWSFTTELKDYRENGEFKTNRFNSSNDSIFLSRVVLPQILGEWSYNDCLLLGLVDNELPELNIDKIRESFKFYTESLGIGTGRKLGMRQMNPTKYNSLILEPLRTVGKPMVYLMNELLNVEGKNFVPHYVMYNDVTKKLDRNKHFDDIVEKYRNGDKNLFTDPEKYMLELITIRKERFEKLQKAIVNSNHKEILEITAEIIDKDRQVNDISVLLLNLISNVISKEAMINVAEIKLDQEAIEIINDFISIFE